MIRPQRNAQRDLIELNGTWRAMPDHHGEGVSAGWQKGLPEDVLSLAVPGSWNEQLAELGLMNFVGDMWMEKRIFISRRFGADRALWLRFGSVDFEASVWVNGQFAGVSGAHFLPFEIDIEPFIQLNEEAVVVVRVSAQLPMEGPTQRVTAQDYVDEGRTKDEYLPAVRFDFFPYGGINRPVYLLALPRNRLESVRITPRLTGSDGVFVMAIGTTSGINSVAIECKCDTLLVRGVASVIDGQANLEITVPNCPLWSPQDPRLFNIAIKAFAGEEAIDQIEMRAGMREVRVDGHILRLNGQPITLKGFGKHEDSPIHGRGLNLPQMVKDFHLLDWSGANSVRTSHYPYSEEFYDFCDERGILVIDEVFSINLDFRRVTAAGLAAHKDAVTKLIARDISRTCVIAWSLANEPGYLGEACYAQASAPYWAELFSHARNLDPSRPLTHANVSYAGLDDPAFEHSDFLMINRYYGWYQAPADLPRAIDMLNADFDHLAKAHNKAIFVSEFGADAMAGQHATYPQLFTEDFQSEFVEAYWHAILAHPAVIGGHVWNFADFRTAQHGRRVVYNLKGVFTRDRTPKKAAFTLRKLWTQ